MLKYSQFALPVAFLHLLSGALAFAETQGSCPGYDEAQRSIRQSFITGDSLEESRGLVERLEEEAREARNKGRDAARSGRDEEKPCGEQEIDALKQLLSSVEGVQNHPMLDAKNLQAAISSYSRQIEGASQDLGVEGPEALNTARAYVNAKTPPALRQKGATAMTKEQILEMEAARIERAEQLGAKGKDLERFKGAFGGPRGAERVPGSQATEGYGGKFSGKVGAQPDQPGFGGKAPAPGAQGELTMAGYSSYNKSLHAGEVPATGPMRDMGAPPATGTVDKFKEGVAVMWRNFRANPEDAAGAKTLQAYDAAKDLEYLSEFKVAQKFIGQEQLANPDSGLMRSTAFGAKELGKNVHGQTTPLVGAAGAVSTSREHATTSEVMIDKDLLAPDVPRDIRAMTVFHESLHAHDVGENDGIGRDRATQLISEHRAHAATAMLAQEMAARKGRELQEGRITQAEYDRVMTDPHMQENLLKFKILSKQKINPTDYVGGVADQAQRHIAAKTRAINQENAAHKKAVAEYLAKDPKDPIWSIPANQAVGLKDPSKANLGEGLEELSGMVDRRYVESGEKNLLAESGGCSGPRCDAARRHAEETKRLIGDPCLDMPELGCGQPQ